MAITLKCVGGTLAAVKRPTLHPAFLIGPIRGLRPRLRSCVFRGRVNGVDQGEGGGGGRRGEEDAVPRAVWELPHVK